MSEWCVNFTSGSVATLLGIIVGLPVALFIDRVIKNKQHKESRNTLVKTIIQSINKNIEVLKRLEESLPRNTMPFFNVDIVVFESLAHECYSLLDLESANTINEIRYQLTHYNRKLDKLVVLYDQILNELISSKSFDSFKASVGSHASFIIKDLENAKNLILKNTNYKMQ